MGSMSSTPTHVEFNSVKLVNGVEAWHDRNYQYVNVPDELVGTTLFRGPHKSTPVGTKFTIKLVSLSRICVWAESSVSRNQRNGGHIRVGVEHVFSPYTRGIQFG